MKLNKSLDDDGMLTEVILVSTNHLAGLFVVMLSSLPQQYGL
jgi:hypothetical protein